MNKEIIDLLNNISDINKELTKKTNEIKDFSIQLRYNAELLVIKEKQKNSCIIMFFITAIIYHLGFLGLYHTGISLSLQFILVGVFYFKMNKLSKAEKELKSEKELLIKNQLKEPV